MVAVRGIRPLDNSKGHAGEVRRWVQAMLGGAPEAGGDGDISNFLEAIQRAGCAVSCGVVLVRWVVAAVCRNIAVI